MTEAEWTAFLQRPEIAVFNRAMLVNPDDDLPRLVFADWLDENCPDPRAGKAVRDSLTGRLGDVDFLPASAGLAPHTDRGRLKLHLHAETPPSEFVRRAVWESGWVGRVMMRETPKDFHREWLSHPRMAGVEVLEIFHAGVEAAGEVAASDHLTGVWRLDLQACRLGPGGVRALATAKLPALRELGLLGTFLADDGVAVLAASATFAGLSTLDLSRNQIGPVGLRALAGSPHLTRLQTLSLSNNQIGDEGLAAIAGSAGCAGLRYLGLYQSGIGPAGMGSLGRSPHLRGLHTLFLNCNPLTDEGVRQLAGSPNMAGLTSLQIADCRLFGDAVRALAESPLLHTIRQLDLSSNYLGGADWSAFAASPLFARLERLGLRGCHLDAADVRALAAAPRFRDPRPLDLELFDNFDADILSEVDVGSLPPVLAGAVRHGVRDTTDYS